MIHVEKFDTILAKAINSAATKKDKCKLYYTWKGWVTKDVLHIISGSGARRRPIWHFDIKKNTGREMFFKNTIGTADCWTVIPAEQEADPYERLLRLCKQSKKVLHRHNVGERVDFSGRWAHLYCHVPGRSSSTLITDSDEDIQKGRMVCVPGGYFRYYDWEASLSKATWAVVRGAQADSNGYVWKSINALHIWGNPDVEEVTKAVASWIYSDGADMEFLEAKASGDFSGYLSKRIKPGHSCRHICIGDNEYEIQWSPNIGISLELSLEQQDNTGGPLQPQIVFSRQPQEKKLELMPKLQREYAEALMDIEKAKVYLRKNVQFFLFEDKLYYLSDNERNQLIKVDMGHKHALSGQIEVLKINCHGQKLIDYAMKIARPVKVLAEVEYKKSYAGDDFSLKYDWQKWPYYKALNCFWLHYSSSRFIGVTLVNPVD